jgi:hypothetical protein
MDFLDAPWVTHIQWPAMAATLVAAFLVGSHSARLRVWGFGLFVISNVLWVIWGLPEQAWALIVLQIGLFLLNARGAKQNAPEAEEEAESGESMLEALEDEVLPGHQPAETARS